MIKDRFYISKIDAWQTHDWLLHKHYARRIPSISFAFGLFNEKNIMAGVVTYGKPASPSLCDGVCGVENRLYVYELNRLCVSDGLPQNALSFFVSKSLNYLPPLIIVSYADTAQNHNGFIYQATNWLYTGLTKERTDIAKVTGGHSRHYDKKQDYTKNRIFRSGKHRYVIFTGNKRQKRQWRNSLKYKVLPYPKGQNTRYDASYTPITQARLF